MYQDRCRKKEQCLTIKYFYLNFALVTLWCDSVIYKALVLLVLLYFWANEPIPFHLLLLYRALPIRHKYPHRPNVQILPVWLFHFCCSEFTLLQLSLHVCPVLLWRKILLLFKFRWYALHISLGHTGPCCCHSFLMYFLPSCNDPPLTHGIFLECFRFLCHSLISPFNYLPWIRWSMGYKPLEASPPDVTFVISFNVFTVSATDCSWHLFCRIVSFLPSSFMALRRIPSIRSSAHAFFWLKVTDDWLPRFLTGTFGTVLPSAPEGSSKLSSGFPFVLRMSGFSSRAYFKGPHPRFIVAFFPQSIIPYDKVKAKLTRGVISVIDQPLCPGGLARKWTSFPLVNAILYVPFNSDKSATCQWWVQ
jgi:hypothetical protein